MTSVMDLLQVWLGLGGVAVVMLAGLMYAAMRLGWAGSGDADDDLVAVVTD